MSDVTRLTELDVLDHNGTTTGLYLAGTLVTATAAELNAIDGVTASAAQLNFVSGVTAGTVTASKAVVVDANKHIDTIGIAAGGLKIGTSGSEVAVDTTAAELNTRCDDSAMVDTRADAGAISTSTAYTAVTTTGAAAITLAVPTKPAFIKVIKMTTDGGDATLALTNVVGGSAATTCTFNDVGDTLVLVSDTVSGKWVVLAEVGVTMA